MFYSVPLLYNIIPLKVEIIMFLFSILLEDPCAWGESCIFILVPSEQNIQQKLLISHPLISIAVVVSQPFCRSIWNMQVWWNRVQWGGKMTDIVMRITGVFRMRVCLCVCVEPTLGEGWRRHILSCLVCRYVASGFNPSSSSLNSYHIKDTVMTSVTSLSHNSWVLYQPDLHLNAASLDSFSSPWNETRLC